MSKFRRRVVVVMALYGVLLIGLVAAPAMGLYTPVHAQTQTVTCTEPGDSTALAGRTTGQDCTTDMVLASQTPFASNVLGCCACLFLIGLAYAFSGGGDYDLRL